MERSKNMYIKLYEKALFLVFFPPIVTPKLAQMHTDSMLKMRKKTCFNSKKGPLS